MRFAFVASDAGTAPCADHFAMIGPIRFYSPVGGVDTRFGAWETIVWDTLGSLLCPAMFRVKHTGEHELFLPLRRDFGLAELCARCTGCLQDGTPRCPETVAGTWGNPCQPPKLETCRAMYQDPQSDLFGVSK